ncbi:DUF4214 domain-containing protein [Vreelandella venusta]|uniref:DUF4214 domain-containing protein n=1 Tax=Vreelandella venusta TaxID=44935 RepID=A0AAQ0CGM1_9GAMM|nr:DUF4214 domain-containing protein [Halomonas venusta]AZM96699.1 DUF4214 domain-containing protein [Halomonas venusta]NPT29978.1 hypothetical protein [Halomonas venusta]QPI62987.1 DUF4214 domain-containing protein [Halomonas venusta]QRL02167.1 DUF4214 domain-containing protein [Halomonas venusta]UQI39439.1 DUF4214 domain-containing protein [Halomonas venusta]
MATQENLNLAQQLYVAYYGRPADAAGLQFWAEEIEANGIDAAISAFGNSAEFTERFGDLDNEELVNGIYQQAFGRDADAEGLAFYTEKLESGELDLATIALTIVQNATDTDAKDASALEAKVAAADKYTVAAGDKHSGEAADDYAAEFLSTVDADTDVDALDLGPVVAGIPSDGGDGDGDGGEPSETINIDFNNTTSVGGNGSFIIDDEGRLVFVPGTEDADGGYVAVENGTGGTTVSNIGKIEWDEAGQVVTSSKDYTFNLADQLHSGEQYNGLFLSPVLTAEDRSADSQLFIDLLDLRTAQTNRPLGDLPVNGFRFSVGGETVVLQSEDIFAAETYPELLTAVQNAIAASDDPLLEGFQATLGGEFRAQDDQGVQVSGTTLVLTDSKGRQIESGNFTYSEDASAGGFTLYGEQSTEAPQSIQELIETNLNLDNIGYGSQGGSINLVGQSNSDKGIEQMNVTADNTVWLTRLESDSAGRGNTGANVDGSQFLKEINLEGEGKFLVGQQDGEAVLGLADLVGADTTAYGLVDVQDFNGGSYNGDIKLNAIITEEVVARDLDAMDDDVDPKSDNATFNYTTAAGDDQVSLALSDELMAREDANVVVDTGAGDDVVETFITLEDSVSFDDLADLSDQQLNANLTIATGEGNDVVRTWGAGDAVIGTGTGNDVVYADNSGFRNDRWEFNSTAAAGAMPTDVSNSDTSLSDTANGVKQTFSVDEGAEIQVRVSFKGHETVWVDVPSTDGGNTGDTISTLQVNQAIKDAVNNDHVLANLLEAFDGDGNILNIESLIDGNNLDALDISFRDHNSNTTSTDGLAAINALYGEKVDSDVSGQTLGGADSEAESDNTIDVGAGNDVVVLGTGEFSNDTLVLVDQFGNNDIVNFTVGDVNGHDILDFTSYGVNRATVGSNDYNVANDEVNLVSFNAADFDADTTFANLNADDIRDAIGNTVDNGRVDSIVMVESGNKGMYKVFDINSANDSTSYTVELVGTLDFGDSLALVDANIA